MDSNHRCLGVGQKSSPLDHGINRKVDSSGIAPPVFRFLLTGLGLQDRCLPVGPRVRVTCRRQAEAVGLEPTSGLHPPPVFKTGSSSGRMTSVVKLRELESNRAPSPWLGPSGFRAQHRSLPAATIPQWMSVEGHNSDGKVRELRGQESNLRTRGSKPRISTNRDYPASSRGTGGTRTHARVLNKHLLCR